MGSVFYRSMFYERLFGSIGRKPIFTQIVLCLSFIFLVAVFPAQSQTTNHPSSSNLSGSQNWIFQGTTSEVEGMGVADYSRFNPEKSWKKALRNAVNDLNANHSLIVSYYGYRIGRGPLRIRSNYAIRTFLDTTQVTVIDSALWKGKAFIRIKPTTALSDSVIYPGEEFHSVNKTVKDTASIRNRQWLVSTGSTPSINSNWYMSVTKAKQDALRRLAEDLSVKVKSETYALGETSRNYYNFSTLYAFQRIRVLKREFGSDTVKVKVAVNPQEVKMLMD